VVRSDGSGLKRLRDGGSPSWSPAGKRIAYVNADGTLFVRAANGKGARRISARYDTGGSRARATWSPDGRRLAWTSAMNGQGVLRIATIKAPVTVRTVSLPDVTFGNPDWSPDGRHFAILGDGGVYVMGADGSGLRRIVPPEPKAGFEDVRWSPDGHRLLFVREISDFGRSGVYTVRPDGSGVRALLIRKCCGLWGASWSPNGRAIVYSENATLHIVNVQSRRIRDLRLPPCWRGACFGVDW
jgi:TolB protein